MMTYNGKPMSVLRHRIMQLMDALEAGDINDAKFIDGVFRVLGHDRRVGALWSDSCEVSDNERDLADDFGPYGD